MMNNLQNPQDPNATSVQQASQTQTEELVPLEEQFEQTKVQAYKKADKMTGGKLTKVVGVLLAIQFLLGVFGTDIKESVTWGYETTVSFITGEKKEEPVQLDEKTRDAISDNASTIKTLTEQLAEQNEELDERDKIIEDLRKRNEELLNSKDKQMPETEK